MLKYAVFLLGLITVGLSLDPVEVKGNAFFVKGSDTRFYIRGVDYQPGGSSDLFDPLADAKTCERDIKYFKDLGINTIRVYSIDNTAKHDECMKQLADAGIYVIMDTNIPDASISRADPECSYNTNYLNEVLASVKLMAKYDNLLGFFAGNEVINDDKSTWSAPYVKAVVRDIKTYIKNAGLRKIPVGYSAADIEENRLDTAHYFNCGDDELARSDMFGFNDYSWCGKSSFTGSGYDKKVKEYSNYSIPLFLSEYGCNKITPRPFTEVEALYSEKMTSVFSGGLVYEYSEETSNYGLVKISKDKKSASTNDDFDNLKSEFSKTSNPTGDGKYQSDLDHSKCPSKSLHWNATGAIPDTPKGALKYIKDLKDPKGGGFKASTQWACVAKGNNVDDTGDYKGGKKSLSSSGSSTKSSSGSGSSGSSGSGSGSSSSKSSSGNIVKFGYLNFFIGLVGLFI